MSEKPKDLPTLHLNLTKKWFDMYEKGIKKEDYRDIKNHWITRLTYAKGNFFKTFKSVTLTNGYTKNAPQMEFEFKETSIGMGKQEWGAKEESFIIKIGKRIK